MFQLTGKSIAVFVALTLFPLTAAFAAGDASYAFKKPCSEVPKCQSQCESFKKDNAEFEKCKSSKGYEKCSAEDSKTMASSFALLGCMAQQYPDEMKKKK